MQNGIVLLVLMDYIAIGIIYMTSIKKQLQKIERKVGMEYQKEYKQG